MKLANLRLRLSSFLIPVLLAPAAWADVGLTLKAGTLGAGGELTFPLASEMNLRLGGNAFDYIFSRTPSNIDYHAKLELASATALLDYHPGGGGFRVSAGGLLNENRVTLTGVPAAGATFTINGTVYSNIQVSSVAGRAEFNQAAPYAGIGYGNAVSHDHRWSVAFDLGVIFQGSPKLRETAIGSVVGTAAFQSDLGAEVAKAQKDLRPFQYYPVVSLGFSYRF